MPRKKLAAITLPDVVKYPAFDPIGEAQNPDHLLVVMFGKSASDSYPLAVELAKSARKYAECMVGKKMLHMVAFGNSQEDLARAASILRLVGGWNSCQAFAYTGIRIYQAEATAVLDCYLKSLGNKDRRAHCHVVCQEYEYRPDGSGGSKYLLPCKYLEGLQDVVLRDHDTHPSSPPERLQALAIDRGCSWCPHFNAKDFRKLP